MDILRFFKVLLPERIRAISCNFGVSYARTYAQIPTKTARYADRAAKKAIKMHNISHVFDVSSAFRRNRPNPYVVARFTFIQSLEILSI